MSERFVIQGGKILEGEIEVFGAKNASLPILAATLLIKKDCLISNLPRIQDVFTMIEILKSMGAKVDWLDERTVKINTADVDPILMRKDLVGKFRGSVLLFGPLLARFGWAELPFPGGDQIGARPIDTHLDAFKKLGAEVFVDQHSCRLEMSKALEAPKEIVLKEFSVTATENILMAFSLIPQKNRIKIAASDYQVQDLCNFLRKAGVKINHSGFHVIDVEGKSELDGVRHSVIYDPVEAGTFIVCGAVNQGRIRVKNVVIDHLDLFLEKLREFGADFQVERQNSLDLATVSVSHSRNLRAGKIQVLPPPGLYPDFQPLFGLLATQAKGTSLVHDPMYESRFTYLNALKEMGADVIVADPHRAFIAGPTLLSGVNIPSFDLRAGATLVLAGLIAKGQTIINDIGHIDRGYERIEERLQKLGADIQRVIINE